VPKHIRAKAKVKNQRATFGVFEPAWNMILVITKQVLKQTNGV